MFDCNFQHVVQLLLTDLGGSVSQRVLSELRDGKLDNLGAIPVDPSSYDCPDKFFRDYQAVELVRKLNVPSDTIRLTKAAVDTFYTCEAECYQTNLRLKPLVDNYYGDLGNAALCVIPFIQKCKDFIADVLGSIPEELVPTFGKGATFNDRVPLTTIPDKMSNRPTVTYDCYAVTQVMFDRTAWSRAIWDSDSCWAARPPEYVRGNRFSTVPKDSTKRRGICVEPSINLGYQLSIGAHMKRRLKLMGLDLSGPPKENVLSVGQILHRELARAGSIDGSWSTIDLSNASDTVSTQLVKLLLPAAWFELLDSVRSKFTQVDGKWVLLEKFSSMGNGFTFELETLLYASLAHACGGNVGGDAFVYGDDIICRPKVAVELLPVLKFFGFTPNKKKTFLTGNFRESCGGDFFKGKAVRPYYIKELPNEPQDWIKLANGLRRVGLADPNDVVRWYKFRRAWFRALSYLPTTVRRLRGPEWLGDIVIHDDTHAGELFSDGIWRYRCYAPVTQPVSLDHFRPRVQLAALLCGVPSEGPIPRGNVAGYKVKWVPGFDPRATKPLKV